MQRTAIFLTLGSAAVFASCQCGPSLTTTSDGTFHDAGTGGGAAGTGGGSGGAGGTGGASGTGGATGGGTGGSGDTLCGDPLDLSGCPCVAAGLSRSCYTGPPWTQNVGACTDGTQTCEANGELLFWGTCTGARGPTAEVCPGTSDLDCNGKSGCDDPSCAGLPGCCSQGDTRSCYDGPPGTQTHGACKAGTQSCGASGAWPAACPGEVLPGVEVGHCTGGQDDDCDGLVDCADTDCVSDPACRPKACQELQTQPCYTGPAGTSGVGACHGGTQACTTAGQWDPTCSGEVTPSNEVGHCHDGVDNDCDGDADCKDFACLFDPGCAPKVCNTGDTQACYSGPLGTSGVGPCHGGTQTCKSDGTGWNACTGEQDPVPEAGHCGDGADNDCNGKTDCADPSCATAAACCTSSGVVTSTVYAHSPSTLYRVDTTSFTVTRVGDFNAGDSMTDLAVTPSGDVYTISFSALYRVDKTTAQATFVATLGGSGNNSMTFLPNGHLLVADSSGAVTQVDPSNGAQSSVGNFGSGFSNSGDLVGVGSGIMYGISSTTQGGGSASSNNVLLRVDTSTGKATAVGPMGYGDVWGLAYAQSHVLAFTNQGQIIGVDPATGAGVLLSNTGVQFWGAGQSPLVTDNACP